MDFSKVSEQAACTREHLGMIDILSKQVPQGDFMECGVLRGGSAAVLINAAGPERKVWLCDTFKDCTWKGPKDPGINLIRSVGYSVAEVKMFLTKFDVAIDNVEFVQGDFKDTLPGLMKRIGKLALVNFDGDWYESVMSAFPHILKKLEPGGILIIHDYPGFKGLVEAVHEFIDRKDLRKFPVAPGGESVYYVKGE